MATIKDLHQDKSNPRKHGDRNLKVIADSLRDFGFARSIVIDENDSILAGNGVVQAAALAGLENVIEVEADGNSIIAVRRRGLTDEQKQRLKYADNRSGELASWDAGQLLADLNNGLSFDGLFDKAELDALLAGMVKQDPVQDPGPQIDKADELRVKWGVELGQLWSMGAHRLICGDCTDAATVARLMEGERANIVFTDPPYGVAIGAKNRMLNSFQKAGRNLTDIEDDEMSPDDLKTRLRPCFELIKSTVMSDDCTVFVTSPQGGELCMMMMMMMEAGLPIRHVLIWKKNAPTFSMGRLDYDYQHEPILLTWSKRHKRPMLGEHKTSVWEIDKPRASAEHPTMKPVELYVNAYLNNSDSGDIAYEPYCGSGTALIACEQLSRQCRAIEISPAYVAVALQRWADATGQMPVLSGE